VARSPHVREAKDAEQEQRVYDLWMACYTEENIAESVGISRAKVHAKTEKFVQNTQMTVLHIFPNFEPKVYSLWSFGKNTNPVKHFGGLRHG
jgi:hypothetical protein